MKNNIIVNYMKKQRRWKKNKLTSFAIKSREINCVFIYLCENDTGIDTNNNIMEEMHLTDFLYNSIEIVLINMIKRILTLSIYENTFLSVEVIYDNTMFHFFVLLNSSLLE